MLCSRCQTQKMRYTLLRLIRWAILLGMLSGMLSGVGSSFRGTCHVGDIC